MEKDYNEYSNTVFSNTIDKIFDELVDRWVLIIYNEYFLFIDLIFIIY